MTTYGRIALWFARLGALAGLLLAANFAAAQTAPPKVLFQTSIGNFTLEMDPAHAPKTVDNFLRYVREGFFDGIIFHRVVPGFIVQAGGYDRQGRQRDGHDPIPLETATAQSNTRGTVSMARTDFPVSATSQFFINLKDNQQLDKLPGDPGNLSGYTVFGHVIDGMQVVDAMSMAPLGGRLGPFADAEPMTPIIIQKASIVN